MYNTETLYDESRDDMKLYFVVRMAGAGGYFIENGTTLSAHDTREKAEADMAKRLADHALRSSKPHPEMRVEDWSK